MNHRQTIGRFTLLAGLLAAALTGGPAAPAHAQCDQLPGCFLLWSDEFDGTEIDPDLWSFQLGDGTEVGLPPGWGNNELQYYRAENAAVSDGFLTLTARREPFMGWDYTSARLRSLDHGDWTYGRFEMRAKLPIGQGFWPAFWMLPSDPLIYGTWAASGEIDIMEYVGSQPDKIFGSIHYGAPWPGNVFKGTDYFLPEGTFHDDFHVFAVEWEYGEIRWYVDGTLYATETDWYSTGGPYPAPFDVDFYLLLNLAVGGNLPGPPDATSVFPQEYVIDYVRVYRVFSEPPEIVLTSPSDDDDIEPGDDLLLTVEVTDDGTVEEVEFFQDTGKLGADAEAPFELTVPSAAAGCYALIARARDDHGNTASSDPVSIFVGDGCPQSPYLITVAGLPGVVEAENYDLGGFGIAYEDADGGNNGGVYRTGDDADLEGNFDGGFGYHIGWTEAGEWLEYTVDVAAAGAYDVEFRVASESEGGALRLDFDGVDRTGTIAFPATGGWQSWTTVRAEDVMLDAGVQTMRLTVVDGGFNLNRITVAEPAFETPTAAPVVFDDFEDGDASDWGFFGGNNAGGGGGAEDDRPAEGAFYLSTGWGGQGSASVFYGGFFKNLDDAAQPILPADPWLNVWVLNQSDATADAYTLEITIREDLDGNGWTAGAEDSFRLDTAFTASQFDDAWTLLSAPVSDFIDLMTGGDGQWNGRLDEMVVVVSGVAGADGATVEVDFDLFVFTSGGPLVELAVFDDFEDGDASDWGFFGGNNAGGGGGAEDDRPAEGAFYLSTGWGGQGSASVFYGGFFKNLDDGAQLQMPFDPWFNVWVLNQSDATADAYTLEITIREDLDGNGWSNGAEDSFRLDTVFPRSQFVGEWTLLSAPVADFVDLLTGGDGTFDGRLDEVVVVVSGVTGADGATVEVDLDYFAFTAGGPLMPPPPPNVLALRDGRFLLEVDWQTRSLAGAGQAVALTDDTGYFWFFNPDNAEILVKVLDACNLEGFNDFWVFSAGLTDVEYELQVTDTQTGQRYTVYNPLGFAAPPVLTTDTLFRECGDGDGAGLPRAQLVDTDTLPPAPEPDVRESQDDELIGACVAGEEAVCLTGGRFRVSATWRDFAGGSGPAAMEPLAADSGYGTFFSDSNVELFFKVLDACNLAGFNRFWPFVTGLTNVEVDLEIVDTWSGKLYEVRNPAGAVFPTVLDTGSFLDDCALEPPP